MKAVSGRSEFVNAGDVAKKCAGKTERIAYPRRGDSADGENKDLCSACGKIITSEMYTDRFYERLCIGCLIRLHKI